MGAFRALGLLLLKDLRSIIRRKASFIVELIILIFTLVIVGLLCFVIEKMSKGLPPLEYDLWPIPDDAKQFYVKMTNGFNKTEEVYVMNWLKLACPMYNFEGTAEDSRLTTTLWLKDFKVTGDEADHKLNYEIIGYDTESFGLPTSKMHGGLFGELTPQYANGEVKMETLFLQNCINRAFLQRTRKDGDPVPLLATGFMPSSKGSTQFFKGVGGLFTFVILIVILLALKEIVVEKENGIHAYMLAVGIPRWTFFASHYIFAYVKVVTFLFVAFFIITGFGSAGTAAKIIIASYFYGNCIIAFTLMIATFCKRNLYVTLAVLAYVITGNIIKTCIEVTVFTQTSAMLLSFAHPVIAFNIVLEHFDTASAHDRPVRFFNGYSEYLPIFYPFFFMLIHFVFFMVMTFYIDYVVPTDDTPKLHPLFFLGRGKKEEEKSDDEAEKGSGSKEKEKNSRHEEIQATGELQLEVKDLVKKWPNGDTAVNKISFKVHSGQVVALLGHNGAGKSTTFSCLTGFLKPTSGTIKLVNGGRVGYCPQWDPLFPNLTVKEHLVFYSKLFTGKSPDAEVMDATLEKIELDKAAGTLSKNLSGGMKRKLSLGIALISDAKVILLDEPTAGIDTFARRNMVKVIEKAKSDHAVVITTHYMDEADALSDHINIMAHGEIICSGSSEFLKSKFGTGIMLVVDLDLSHREKMDVITNCANMILDVVKKSCPDAEFYGPVASQLNIIIGTKNRPAFPQLFADLEQQTATLKIESFDVTLNSLDQVFVNVTKEAEGGSIKPDEEIMKFIDKRKECNQGTFLFLNQMKALFIRKFHNFRRDYFQIGVVTLAFFLILVAAVMKKTNEEDKDAPKLNKNNTKKATREFDIPTYFNFNVELFSAGDDHNLQSQMASYLRHYNIEPRAEHDPSEDISSAYKEMMKSRWIVPTPTMYFLFNATVSLAMINPGFYHGEYIAQHMFYEAYAPGKITGRITFEPHVPFDPPTVKTQDLGAEEKDKNQALMILIMVYPLIFALPVFLYTTERVQGAVHLYSRTHLTKFIYWLTAFISELGIFFIFSSIIAFILFSTSFYHISCLGPYLLITFLLSFAFIAQSYAASQLFNSSGVTFTMLMVWNFVVFMILTMAITLIATKFKPIVYLSFLMPSLAMFQLFVKLEQNCSAKTTLKTIMECDDCDIHPLALIGGTTALHAALLIGVLVYPRIAALFTKKNNNNSTETDTPDITKERERVETGGISKHAVVAIGLRKDFGYPWKRKTVVHNVTFGVGKNECFGLLGSNGAGKSTTFNMLTASLRPTAGKAYVGGTSVANSPEFGFCPQKESILMELTVHETLLLFARLSGINETHEVAKLVMNCLQLTARKDVLVRRCSGGEKRRVSIGVALITDPNILMLDEPTAGVDPHTRRFVWETLLTLKNTGASMILTSHSMEECEALCTRIAFLTGGNMIALGTSQHLKHTLGNEYVLTVSLHGSNPKLFEELDKRFKEAFEATGENDPTDVNLKWTFKKKNQKMSVLYTKLDEIVASAETTSGASNEPTNTKDTKNTQPSSAQPSSQQPSSAAPSAEKTQQGTEGGGKKGKQSGVRECIIVGATLEDIFIRLAQSGAPIPAVKEPKSTEPKSNEQKSAEPKPSE